MRRTIWERFCSSNPRSFPGAAGDATVTPIVVIPVRMAATRLPGKPLADIGGRPMIAHVLDRAREAAVGPVAVACAEAEVAEAVRCAGSAAR